MFILAAGNTAVCYWSTGSCWNEMGDTRWSQHPTTATRRHRNDTKTVLPCCSFVSRPQLISIQDKFISWSSPERKKRDNYKNLFPTFHTNRNDFEEASSGLELQESKQFLDIFKRFLHGNWRWFRGSEVATVRIMIDSTGFGHCNAVKTRP